jgi:hypothetical protein
MPANWALGRSVDHLDVITKSVNETSGYNNFVALYLQGKRRVETLLSSFHNSSKLILDLVAALVLVLYDHCTFIVDHLTGVCLIGF